MARAVSETSWTPLDARVLELFYESIDSLGGLKGLAEGRRLDWLTELLESAYIVILHEREQKSGGDIAEATGLSTGAVNAVLDAPIEGAAVRLLEEPPEDRLDRDNTAGGITKFAYQRLGYGEETRV